MIMFNIKSQNIVIKIDFILQYPHITDEKTEKLIEMRNDLLQSHIAINRQEGARFCLCENMAFCIYNTVLCISTDN